MQKDAENIPSRRRRSAVTMATQRESQEEGGIGIFKDLEKVSGGVGAKSLKSRRNLLDICHVE